jgi:hypothetical protein
LWLLEFCSLFFINVWIIWFVCINQLASLFSLLSSSTISGQFAGIVQSVITCTSCIIVMLTCMTLSGICLSTFSNM